MGKYDDADYSFLMSVLPNMRKMTEEQKRRFKIGILTMAGNILGEKPPANVSCEDFSPGSSTSHASGYKQYQPGNIVTHRTLHITTCLLYTSDRFQTV